MHSTTELSSIFPSENFYRNVASIYLLRRNVVALLELKDFERSILDNLEDREDYLYFIIHIKF